MQSCGTLSAPRRLAVPRAPMRRPRAVLVRAGASDHAARVRGDAAQVCFFCSDLTAWPAWSPITKSAVKLGNQAQPIQKGTRFELQQELFGGVMAYSMLYQIIDFEPGKKLVLSGLSEHHTQVDQFIFMPDKHDPDMTVVRYVVDTQLREWKWALQPVASKLLSRVPEDAMNGIQKLLNGPQSPILSPEFQQRFKEHARQYGIKTAPSGAKARGARGGGAGGSREGSGFSWGSGASGWSFDNLWGGSRSSGDGDDLPGRAAATRVNPDPAGHYATLGLGAVPPPSADDVRAAYRRLVMELHPDKQAGKSAHVQRQAADDLSRVMKAYETLRDPEARRLYDSGQLVEQGADS